MRIRLADESDVDHRHACPDHGCDLVYEDGDEYGTVYLCPVIGCPTSKYDGLSRDEILRREQGVGLHGRGGLRP